MSSAAPENSRRVSLGEIFDIGSSRRVIQAEWRQEGVPFYRAREIVKLARDGSVDNELFISESHFEVLSGLGGAPQAGDLMVSAVGTLGACYLVKETDRFYYKDASVLLFRPKANVDPEFIRYAFLSDELLAQVHAGEGATVGTFTIERARRASISLPPLNKQRRIVAVLDQAFAALDSARANAEMSLADASAILDTTLAGIFSGSNPGWKAIRLEEVCAITSSLVDPREPRFVSALHVGAGNIESKTGRLFDLRTSQEEKLISGKFPFDGSMVLYSKIRPYLKKVARPDFVGICSADMYPLTPIEGRITRDFLYWLLLSKPFTEYAIEGSARAGMPKVNRDHLFQYEVELPDVHEQRGIVAKLDALCIEVNTLQVAYECQLADIAALRQAMLQAAFSGQLT